jgi:DNA-binding NtrC family response regulator
MRNKFMTGKYKVLFVDDEENILKALKRLFFMETALTVYTAESAEEGERIISADNIDVVVSDEKMPDKSGHEFLNYVKKQYPDTVRIMLTGHADMKSLMSAVNKGEVYSYLLKPWDDSILKMTIYKGIEYLELKRENSRLQKLIDEYKYKLKIR